MEKENTELHDKVNLLVQEKATITRELEKVKVSTLITCFFTNQVNYFLLNTINRRYTRKGNPFSGFRYIKSSSICIPRGRKIYHLNN